MTDSLERVRRLRARRKKEGKRRVDAYLSGALLSQVQRFADKEKVSVATAIEQLVCKALKLRRG
jgi:hypothetical protein